MLNRQALEDAVYDSYRDMDMSSIQRMPDAKLQWLLDEKRTKRDIKKQDRIEQVKPPKLPKPDPAKWEKLSAAFEVRDGVLVHVERWLVTSSEGQSGREYVQRCGERIWYEGRSRSSSIVRWYLLTGEWVRRIPKPQRFRAVVREGKRTKHLGYFASAEERDAAVFAWRLGIYPNGLKSA